MAAEFITYQTRFGGVMRAKVIRRFMNGAMTIEPWFWQRDGKDSSQFRGGIKIHLRAGQYTQRSPEKEVQS